jgi:very-short-patch-repair endonuclease
VRLAVLDPFASRHHGLVTRWVADDLGVGKSSWYRAIESRELEPLHPNVARLWGSPTTLTQRALAAAWAAGDGAMASHRTSATLWGVERTDDVIDLLVPSRKRNLRLEGVVIHRPQDRLDLRPIMRDRVPTTNPMRMLLDLGAVDPDSVYDAMVAVMAAKAASPAAIRSALVRHAKQGRHGVTALRQALEQWLGEELPPDSELEVVMAKFVVEHRLPAVAFHARVEGFEVDFLVEGTRVVLECDGWGTHGLDRDQFEFDRIRDAVLVAAGFTVVHVTWRQLQQTPLAVADRIRRVLARVGHPPA